jgi:mannonate dehydratase
MIELAEIVGSDRPQPYWRILKQIGVDSAVGLLPRSVARNLGGVHGWTGERAWDYGPLALYKRYLEDAGLKLTVIEDCPPMDAVRLGRDGRDAQLEDVCTLIRNMGRLGIPVLCYNWMPVLGVQRTSTARPGRGGAHVTAYEHSWFDDAPLTAAGTVGESELWAALEWFLTRVVPVAEEAGVRLAMHPDDPPISPVRGIARIMSSVGGFQRLIELVPSPVNGITLCQGNFTLFSDDLPATIRTFGGQGKIFFVHFRDVVGTPRSFVETFHDEGQTDMAACIRAYRDVGYDGPLRFDHTPMLEGESAAPGASSMGPLFAIGYIKGLIDAVNGEGAC